MKRLTLILSLLFVFSATTQGQQFPLNLIRTIPSDTINSIFGVRIVSLGNQDDDGLNDLLLSNVAGHGYVFHSSSVVDTLSVVRIDSFHSTISSNVGDVNGDGYDDIAANGRSPANWRMNIFFGGPNIDTIPDMRFGVDNHLPIGNPLVTNDINQNGSPEFIATNLNSNEIQLYELGSDGDSIPDIFFGAQNQTILSTFGEGLIKGDFNADGVVDIAVSFRAHSLDSLNGEIQFFWGGDSFDSIPDYVIKRQGIYSRGNEQFGSILRNLGDVNGDGYDDIFACPGNSFDTLSFVYYCGIALDTIPDVTIAVKPRDGNFLGDINNDGYNDLITNTAVAVPGLNFVYIFFGGIQMDSIWDVRITQNDLPNIVNFFGHGVAGIGDVNGDGIDDFAISAEAALNQGLVYLFSGFDMSTDVETIEDDVLPKNFKLNQNYPNPFNPETTIEFSLKMREHVTLTIFNTLGQQVRTLTNKSLGVGSYRVIWDGADNANQQVASGMYFYKLQVGDSFVQTKKMILLK